MIAIYITPDAMTAEQHSEGRRRLREAGVSETAMRLHSVFGDEGKLQVFDIWESKEAWDELLGQLVPILQELGITMSAPPMIMPVVDLVQQ
jgi:hypothetical protein